MPEVWSKSYCILYCMLFLHLIYVTSPFDCYVCEDIGGYCCYLVQSQDLILLFACTLSHRCMLLIFIHRLSVLHSYERPCDSRTKGNIVWNPFYLSHFWDYKFPALHVSLKMVIVFLFSYFKRISQPLEFQSVVFHYKVSKNEILHFIENVFRILY